MKVSEMPDYAKQHKPIKNSFIYCMAATLVIFIQLILMKNTAYTVIFLTLTPGVAAVCYAFHSITMSEDRPAMLTLMPVTYFLSLLINELIAVEVGAPDTYPYIPLLEIIPVIPFCISVSTNKFKEKSKLILKIWIGIAIAGSLFIAVLAVFFNARITHALNNIKASFGIIAGIVAVIFMYLSMIELLKISGSKASDKPFLEKRLNSAAKSE